MRLFAVLFISILSLGFAGPDAVFYAQHNVIENGEVYPVQTERRFKIGGVGELPALIKSISSYPKPAQFVYVKESGKWLISDELGYQFAPAKAKHLYLEAVRNGDNEFYLPIAYVEPKSGAQAMYDMGIRELLSEQTTYFAGSSQERAYNVALGASKLNGQIVKQGEIFDFSNRMGDVSLKTGFKTAFVISGEQTVEGVGGGMCQVSTTTFRAAYFAGLPIVTRQPHSYQVHYYAPIGLDAMVYLPYQNLRFRNDTPGSILIKTQVVGRALTFRIFGTKDRSASVSNPVYLSKTPAKPTRYLVNEGMARGQWSQVDFPAEGATVAVYRTIKFDNGVTKKETLSSTYKPWGAVWMAGPGSTLRNGRVLTSATDDFAGTTSYRILTQTR